MNSSLALKGVLIFSIFQFCAVPLAQAAGLEPTHIIQTINQERTSRGLSALKANSALTQAAQERSAVLAQTGAIFHVSAPKGTPWPEISRVGYEYTLAGENLALGIESAGELTSRWMASPTHRENILESEFEDIGVGVTLGNYQGITVSYVVTYYAKKKAGVAPAPTKPATPVISSSPLVSAPVVTSSKRVPAKASAKVPAKKVEVHSPVLSENYTLETLPPAAPDISHSPNPKEEGSRVVDQLIAIFGSYLRMLLMRVG